MYSTELFECFSYKYGCLLRIKIYINKNTHKCNVSYLIFSCFTFPGIP